MATDRGDREHIDRETLAVAAAQTVSIRGDVEANLDQHRRLAARAGAMGARLVVFPELSLTGYETDLAAALAFSAQDQRLNSLVELVDASGVVLVVGAPIRLPSGLHIGAFVLEPGRAPRIYTKRHLHGGEEAVFVPGAIDPMIEIDGQRAAVAICADTSHAVHAESAAKRGARLYLAGAFFTPDGYPADSERLAGYAARHSMAVVMANAGRGAAGLESAGGSAVWSESGALVARLEGDGAGLVIATRAGGAWKGETVRP